MPQVLSPEGLARRRLRTCELCGKPLSTLEKARAKESMCSNISCPNVTVYVGGAAGGAARPRRRPGRPRTRARPQLLSYALGRPPKLAVAFRALEAVLG